MHARARARTHTHTHTHTPIIYNCLPSRGYITTAVEEETLNELKIKYSLLVAEHGHPTPPTIWRNPESLPPTAHPQNLPLNIHAHLRYSAISFLVSKMHVFQDAEHEFHMRSMSPCRGQQHLVHYPTAPADLHKTRPLPNSTRWPAQNTKFFVMQNTR